jgi:protein-tyrosine-phosphatase
MRTLTRTEKALSDRMADALFRSRLFRPIGEDANREMEEATIEPADGPALVPEEVAARAVSRIGITMENAAAVETIDQIAKDLGVDPGRAPTWRRRAERIADLAMRLYDENAGEVLDAFMARVIEQYDREQRDFWAKEQAEVREAAQTTQDAIGAAIAANERVRDAENAVEEETRSVAVAVATARDAGVSGYRLAVELGRSESVIAAWTKKARA